RTDEPLFELETEKATTEIATPATGTLRITVPEGEMVNVGAVIGRIEEGAAPPLAASQPAKPQAAVSQPAKPQAGEPSLSPAARRLAEENAVAVNQLSGTGRDGRVTKEDVVNFLEK